MNEVSLMTYFKQMFTPKAFNLILQKPLKEVRVNEEKTYQEFINEQDPQKAVKKFFELCQFAIWHGFSEDLFYLTDISKRQALPVKSKLFEYGTEAYDNLLYLLVAKIEKEVDPSCLQKFIKEAFNEFVETNQIKKTFEKFKGLKCHPQMPDMKVTNELPPEIKGD